MTLNKKLTIVISLIALILFSGCLNEESKTIFIYSESGECYLEKIYLDGNSWIDYEYGLCYHKVYVEHLVATNSAIIEIEK